MKKHFNKENCVLFVSSTLLVFLLGVSSFNFTFAQENQNVDFAEQSSFLIETAFWDNTQFCEEAEKILHQK